MILKFDPIASRARTFSQTESSVNGISGIRITSAPPAIPECSAIQPACRPITSRIITRSCDSAVVCNRSSASVAISNAVTKPNVSSVQARSLSIVTEALDRLHTTAESHDRVMKRLRGDIQRSDKTKRQFRAGEIIVDRLGYATDRNATFVKFIGDAQRTFTAKDHEGIDPEDLHVGDGFCVNGLDAHPHAIFLTFDKTAAIARPENRSATRQKSPHVRRIKRTCFAGAE